jgi:hypothetical protein
MVIIILLIALSGLMLAPINTYADSGNNWMYFEISTVVVMVIVMIAAPLIFGSDSNNIITAYNSNVNNVDIIYGSLINYQKDDDIFNPLLYFQK